MPTQNRFIIHSGAIYASRSEVHIDGATSFSNNSATTAGGAVYADFGSSVYVDGNTSFADNLASLAGGAIYANSSNINVNGATYFDSNFADVGGAVYAISSTVDINGVAYFANNSAKLGGAIYAEDSSKVGMDGNTTFAENFASLHGGAIYSGMESELKMDGVTYFALNSASAGGGGAIYMAQSDLQIDGYTAFANNSARDGGALLVEDASEAKIDGTSFFAHNWGYNEGGAVFSSLSDFTIGGESRFYRNSIASSGGAICQDAGNVTLNGASTFVGNAAIFGGGMYCVAGNTRFDTGSTQFIGNFAANGGGAFTAIAPTGLMMTNVTFDSNVAELGGAIGLISPIGNKRAYDDCMFINNSAKDGGAMYVYGDKGPDVLASSVFHDNYARASGGAIYLFGSIELNSTTFAANKAGVEGMAIAVVSEMSEVDFFNSSFKDNVFHCPFGEYGLDSTDANRSRFDTVCQGCSPVTNHVPSGAAINEKSGTPSCNLLPAGTIGGSSGTTVSSLTLDSGYYRTSNKSSVILVCYRREACVGGGNPEQYCAASYEGAYCAVCAKGFSSGVGYSCRECSQTARRSAVGLAFTAVLALLLVAVVLFRYLWTVGDGAEGNERLSPQSLVMKKCAVFQTSLTKVLPLTAIKIVVVVWQIVSQFSAIAGDVYPEAYEVFLSYLSFANFDLGVMMSYSCYFSPDFYGRLLLATIAPLAVLAILAGSNFVAQKRYRGSDSNVLAVRSKHVTAALFFTFFVYSSVSHTIFQTFLCDPLDDGKVYLQADYSLSCLTKRHRVYTAYASVMVIAYPIGIPAFFGWWLVRNRTSLKSLDRHTMAHLHPFSIIWGTYKPARYYYEVVECCRRISLAMASVFLVPNSVNLIAVVLSLAALFVIVSVSMSPFENSTDMRLYCWGNGVVVSSMYIALLMKANESNQKSGMLSVFGGVLITANVIMIAAVLVQSVLLAEMWRGSTATVKEVDQPARRPILVRLEGTRWDKTAPAREQFHEEAPTFITPSPKAAVYSDADMHAL